MSKTTSSKAGTRSNAAIRKAACTSPERGRSLGRLSWSLPSGESLAEFALRFGFLAPSLLGSSIGRVQGAAWLREVR